MATAEIPAETVARDASLEPGRLRPRRSRNEALYFALRNRKFVAGLTVVLFFLALATVGPWLTDADPFEFGYPTGESPSRDHWLGTTSAGQDVFSQFVYGLRSSFVVGAVAGCVASLIAMTIGFVSGYRGGVIDDVLGMLTNVVLVIPATFGPDHLRGLPERGQPARGGRAHRP